MEQENKLLLISICELLRRVFGVPIQYSQEKKIIAAAECIKIFNSPEDFYAETGWALDNPEIKTMEYLLEHKIIKVIGDKIWYFSWLDYQDKLDEIDTKYE